MKVLLIHPNELSHYHLERLVKESLEALGHEVSTLRYRGTDDERLRDDIERLSAKVNFTLVLKGEALIAEHYAAIRSFSGLWYVDHPRDDRVPDWLARGCSSVDIVFATSRGLLEPLRTFNARVEWLVEGAHLELLKPAEADHQYDLSFFGTLFAETNNGDVMGERWQFLARVAEKFDLHLWGADSGQVIDTPHGGYRFSNAKPPVWNEDLAREVARSRVVLGYNSTNKVPFYWSNRTYVTLALKGFLMTPYVPGIEQVFRNHEELVWFHSFEELEELVEYYLRTPAQRERIAGRGYLKTVECFSTRTQVEKMLRTAETKLPLAQPKRSVLFVTDSGYPGCAAAARQWCALLRGNGIRADHLLLEDKANAGAAAGYDCVVMNGYSGLYGAMLEQHRGRKLFAWYSSILQSDLENEIGAVKRIAGARRTGLVDGVICSDENACRLFPDAKWVPLVSVYRPPRSERRFRVPSKINISALGPAKPRKNLATVLAALQYLSDDYVVHTNLPPDYFAERIAALFDDRRIINHGWLSSEDYQALIHDCDFGVQLSVGESYDYVVADHALLERPIICSANIPATPHPELTVKNFEDAGELISVIDTVRRAGDEQRRSWFQRFNRENSFRCEQATRRLRRFLFEDRPHRAPAINTRQPLLSIVFHGRNDNYGGDFTRRLAWSISTVRRAFEKLRPELIFVNWNTIPGSPSLFDDPILVTRREGFKVYMVPASIHRELAARHGYDGVYLEWYAKNFGIRRAKGEYILQINSDNLVLDALTADVLPGPEDTYIGARTDVNADVLTLSPESLTHEKLAPWRGRILTPDLDRPYYVGGSCGEFVLSHRNNWHRICGNVETADRWCIDNVTATHLRRVSELQVFPHSVYHIDHSRVDGKWPGFDFEFGYSGPKWGLADYALEPIEY